MFWEKEAAAQKEGTFHLLCQILDYPVLDMGTSALDKPQPQGSILSPEMASMFDACYIDPAQGKDLYVSPVYATPEDLHGLPPALLILAGKDSLHDEGQQYGEMLKAAGVKTECIEYPAEPHSFTLQNTRAAIEACDQMVAFLKRHFYESKTASP